MLEKINAHFCLRMQLILLFLAAPWLMPTHYGPSPGSVGILLAWTCLAFGFIAMNFCPRGTLHTTLVSSVKSAWICAAAVSSLFAMCQYFGFATDSTFWISNANAGEAYANLRQRNHFATLSNIGLAAVIWRNVQKADVAEHWLYSWAPWAIALLACANAASGSRTGLAQLILLVIFSFVWRGGRDASARSQLGLALLCYAIAATVLPLAADLPAGTGGILSRMQADAPACASRLTLWSNVLHLIAQKPWLGWGWGELDYAHFITLYPGERFCDILDNSHNLPLHLAVELGVPFASLASALTLWLIVRGKPWREVHPTRRLAWAVLGLIGLHSMLEYPLWYGPFQIAVVLVLFLLWLTPIGQLISDSKDRLLSPVVTRVLIGGSTIVLICCLYGGWQYWRVTQIYMLPEHRAAVYKLDTFHKIQDNTLFRDQIHFAELTTTPLTTDNATAMFDLAEAMLHFSPEPKVVQLVIESALLSKRDAEAAFYLQRFKAVFPKEYAAWKP